MRSRRPDETFDERRIREADDAIGGVVAVTAAAIAVLGMARIEVIGPWYATTMSLPFAVVVARRVFIDRWFGIRVGAGCMLAITSVAAAASAILDGGMSSPGFYWGGIVAMLGMAMFPDHRSMLAVGGAITIAVAAGDALVGRPVDVYEFFGALILSIATPATVERIVGLERLHRARSVIDPLTGCLNRRALDNRFAEIEERAAQVPMTVSMISADIDHFKRINDRYGHDVGDRVLAEVAYALRKGVDHFDSVFRAGGEEFVILLVGGEGGQTGQGDAIAVAECLRLAVEQVEVDDVRVTSSFGVAVARGPMPMAELFRTADQRLYEAKRAGRNRVVGPAFDRL